MLVDAVWTLFGPLDNDPKNDLIDSLDGKNQATRDKSPLLQNAVTHYKNCVFAFFVGVYFFFFFYL